MTNQVKKYNVSLQQTYCYILLVIQDRWEPFEKAIDLNKLISHTVAQTSLYASQNGRNFVSNDAEMKAFLGMNSIMSINKNTTGLLTNKLVTKDLKML